MGTATVIDVRRATRFFVELGRLRYVMNSVLVPEYAPATALRLYARLLDHHPRMLRPKTSQGFPFKRWWQTRECRAQCKAANSTV